MKSNKMPLAFWVLGMLATGTGFAAADPILKLKPGAEPVNVNGVLVQCGERADSPSRVPDPAEEPISPQTRLYLRMSTNQLLLVLKNQGIGPCRVEPLRNAGVDILISPTYPNSGIVLTTNMHERGIGGFLRDLLKKGECE